MLTAVLIEDKGNGVTENSCETLHEDLKRKPCYHGYNEFANHSSPFNQQIIGAVFSREMNDNIQNGLITPSVYQD